MSQRITSTTLLLEADGTVSSWNTLPFFGGSSLEDEVAHGDATERARARQDGEAVAVRISIPQSPLAVVNTLFWLVSRGHVASVGYATQYAARAGIKVLQRIEALEKLRIVWSGAYESCDQSAQIPFANRRWPGFAGLSPETMPFKASVFRWVAGTLREMANVTGLPISTMCMAALVAGLAQSIDWVIEAYRDMFALAVRDFCLYLETRVAHLY